LKLSNFLVATIKFIFKVSCYVNIISVLKTIKFIIGNYQIY